MSRSIKSVDLTTIYRDLELFSQELGQMVDRCPKSLSWQHDASRALSLIDEAIDLYCAAYITPNSTEEKRRLLTVAYSALLRTYTLLSRIYQRSRQGAHVLTDAQFGRMSERIYLLKAQLTGFINKTCKLTDPA